jgi:NADH:ubiquinone oxidoreductase subunit E
MLLKIAPPFKFRRRKQCMKPVSGIDEFGAATIRTVYDFYRVKEQVPTVSGLIKVGQSIIFHGENMILRKIIKKLEFKWKETKSKGNFYKFNRRATGELL